MKHTASRVVHTKCTSLCLVAPKPDSLLLRPIAQFLSLPTSGAQSRCVCSPRDNPNVPSIHSDARGPTTSFSRHRSNTGGDTQSDPVPSQPTSFRTPAFGALSFPRL